MNEQKGRRRSIFKKRRQTIAIHDTLREEDDADISPPATPTPPPLPTINAPEIRLPPVEQRRGSSFIKRASQQIDFESSLPPLRPSIVGGGRKSRYTNRKSIREDMPDDSILAKIFDLDNWAEAERELNRRVTISMGKLNLFHKHYSSFHSGALPTMDLNENDMKALLNCKTWETFNNNDRHHFMIKTKLTDERYDRGE